MLVAQVVGLQIFLTIFDGTKGSNSGFFMSTVYSAMIQNKRSWSSRMDVCVGREGEGLVDQCLRLDHVEMIDRAWWIKNCKLTKKRSL